MKKVYLFFLVSLMVMSLVLAANGSDVSGPDTTQAGQGAGNGTQTNTDLQTQNQGAETQLQNQVRVRSGNYENSNGEQIQIQNENQFRLQVGGVEATSDLEIGSEYDPVQNRTRLRTQLSNGQNAEIKIMPNTASERALERLRLKVCSEENNCTIELKEVGSGKDKQLAYELQAERHSRILGLFRAKMEVKAQISAENGEVIRIRKPWWAFLATEPAEE
jgi:TolA-binding protein